MRARAFFFVANYVCGVYVWAFACVQVTFGLQVLSDRACDILLLVLYAPIPLEPIFLDLGSSVYHMINDSA